ncbi:MAG: hypothetical protein K6T16_00875 [Candidatus Pacearchaeota archaeon]|nr:hypothetical protein [Candidatus Pacearchaeota archaeon]
MGDIMSLTEEEILKMDCNYCQYRFYEPNDGGELQRCRAMAMNPRPPVNRKVAELMFTNIFQEYGCCVCKYFALEKEVENGR